MHPISAVPLIDLLIPAIHPKWCMAWTIICMAICLWVRTLSRFLNQARLTRPIRRDHCLPRPENVLRHLAERLISWLSTFTIEARPFKSLLSLTMSPSRTLPPYNAMHKTLLAMILQVHRPLWWQHLLSLPCSLLLSSWHFCKCKYTLHPTNPLAYTTSSTLLLPFHCLQLNLQE